MSEIIWRPTKEHLQNSNIARLINRSGFASYEELHKKSVKDIRWFWDFLNQELDIKWYKPYSKVVEGGLPFATWFIDGQINLVHNCIDKHLEKNSKSSEQNESRIAFIWEGDCGAVKKVSYGDLAKQVNQFASGLKNLGIKKGDRIGLYMPMIPEMVVAFFSVLKLGAVVIPIFSGFGPEPTAIRLNDAKAKMLITADGSFRRGKKVEIKKQADEAVKQVPSIKKIIVAKRTFEEIPFNPKTDLWFDDVFSNNPITTEILNSEDESLIIYTSGTTGKPKGCVHTHAGSLFQIAKEVTFNMDCKKDDVFFWVTDIGWMMGPWEMIGTTFNGATFLIFEGAPDYPKPNRLWEIIEKHAVTILGISPTAIRLLKKSGMEHVKNHNLSLLRILGSTGEAWDEESYKWFFENIGQKKCPIINISGGTEIIGCHLAPVVVNPLKPGTLGGPGLGMDVDVFDDDGKSLKNEVGYLVCKQASPSMTKGFLNDKQRYLDTYFDKWPNIWNHGDWAINDKDGFWFLRGRADDVIKVSGHRTGPAEIEAALMQHQAIAECAAIGVPHEIKGECVVCFAVLKNPNQKNENLVNELKTKVSQKLGKTLTPEEILFVDALPKTRSAKIVRSAIKKKYLGQPIKDTSSIENLDALMALPQQQS